MKIPGKLVVLAVFTLFVAVHSAEEMSLQPRAGLNFKVADGFTIYAWGSIHNGPFLDQQAVLNLPFIKKGLNSWSAAPGFSMDLGNLEKIHFTGGTELVILSRKINKDSLDRPDYFEIRPTGFITLSRPLVGILKLDYLNRFDRRIIRSPQISGNATTRLRYVSQLKVSTTPFSLLQASPYFYYEGYVQNYASNHLCASGIGLTMQPIGGLILAAGYTIRWEPDGMNRSENQIALDLVYTFDFSKTDNLE